MNTKYLLLFFCLHLIFFLDSLSPSWADNPTMGVSTTICGNQCGTYTYNPSSSPIQLGGGVQWGNSSGAGNTVAQDILNRTHFKPPEQTNLVPKPSRPFPDAASGKTFGSEFATDFHPDTAINAATTVSQQQATSAAQSISSDFAVNNFTQPYVGSVASNTQASHTAAGLGIDPINPYNGEFFIHETDLRFPGVGIDFEFIRTYRSRSNSRGDLGFGWDHNYNQKIKAVNSGQVTLSDGMGQSIRFTNENESNSFGVARSCARYNGSQGNADWFEVCGGYVPEYNSDFKVVGYTFFVDKLVLHDINGITRKFDPRTRVLVQISDLNGNTIKLDYDEQNRLAEITDTVDRHYQFSYDQRGNLREVAAVGSPEKVSYAVDTDGDLVSAQPAGGKDGYAYVYDKLQHKDSVYFDFSEIDRAKRLGYAQCKDSCKDIAPMERACSDNCDTQVKQCVSQTAPQCNLKCETSTCNQACDEALTSTCKDAIEKAWKSYVSTISNQCDEPCEISCENSCGWSDLEFIKAGGCTVTAALGSVFGIAGSYESHYYHECGKMISCGLGCVDPGTLLNVGDCVACCLNGDFCGTGNGGNCRNDCVASLKSKWPPKAMAECRASYPMAVSRCQQTYCSQCPTECKTAISTQCQLQVNSQCKSVCYAEPWASKCEASCKAEVDKRVIADPQGRRYGYETALQHNLLEIRHLSDNQLRLRNVYGKEPHSPAFDGVIRQEFPEGSQITMSYYDLEHNVPTLSGSADAKIVIPPMQYEYLNGCLQRGSLLRKTGMPFDDYNKVSSATVVTDREKRTWTLYYNSEGLLLRKSGPPGTNTISTDYYDNGRVKGETTSGGNWSCSKFDSDGALIEQVDGQYPSVRQSILNRPKPLRQIFEWRSNPKRLTRVSNPQDQSKSLLVFDWDIKGNLLKKLVPGLEEWNFKSDDRGRVESITDRTGSKINIAYDPTTGQAARIMRDAAGSAPEETRFTYDKSANLQVIEQVGHVKVVTDWLPNRLVSAQHTEVVGLPYVRSETLKYDSHGQLSSRKDTHKEIQYLFDGEGLLRSVTEIDLHPQKVSSVFTYTIPPSKRSTCFHRDNTGRIDRTVLPEGNEVRLTRSIANSGNIKVKTWRGPHTMETGENQWDYACKEWSTEKPQTQTQIEEDLYNPDGELLEQIDSFGAKSSFFYDWLGRITKARNERGLEYRRSFNELGNMSWEAFYDTNQEQQIAYQNRPELADWFTKPGKKPPLTKDDPKDSEPVGPGNGLIAYSKFQYDLLGRLLNLTQLHAVAGSSGIAGSLIKDGWAQTTLHYDGLESTKRRIVAIDNGEHATNTLFDPFGRVVQINLPTGQTINYSFPSSLEIREERPGSNVGTLLSTTMVSDGRGLPVRQKDSSDTTLWSTEYDDRGLPILVSSEGGGKRSYSWDGFGRLQSATVYDEMGKILSSESYTYDLNDNLIAFADGNKNITTFDYDPLDRLVQEILPDKTSRKTESFFGASGLSLQTKTPLTSSQFSYYPDGNLASVDVTNPDNTKKASIKFNRDLFGRVVDATSSTKMGGDNSHAVTVKVKWDTLGNRVGEEQFIDGKRTGYVERQVNADGLVESINVSDSKITRHYDPLHRLVDLWLDNALVASFKYNGLGREYETTFGNQTRILTTHDHRDRISSVEHFLPGQTIKEDFTYTSQGWPAAITWLTGAETKTSAWKLDAMGRLLLEGSDIPAKPAPGLSNMDSFIFTNAPEWRKYTLDNAHNWTAREKKGATVTDLPHFNANNGLLGGLGTNGKLININEEGQTVTVDSDRSYDYDPFGRLSKVVAKSHTMSFIYDPFGRVIREVLDGNATDFVQDGNQTIGELYADGTQALTLHGGQLDQPILRKRGQSQAYYHWASDGSLAFLTDKAGTSVESYKYAAYGETTIEQNGQEISASSVDNPYGYQGQRYYPEIGLYHMRARWYEPRWGRFLTPDPIGLIGGQNRYSFVGASPTIYTDPLGLDPSKKDQTTIGSELWSGANERIRTLGQQSLEDAMVNLIFPHRPNIELYLAMYKGYTGTKGGFLKRLLASVNVANPVARLVDIAGDMEETSVSVLVCASEGNFMEARNKARQTGGLLVDTVVNSVNLGTTAAGGLYAARKLRVPELIRGPKQGLFPEPMGYVTNEQWLRMSPEQRRIYKLGSLTMEDELFSKNGLDFGSLSVFDRGRILDALGFWRTLKLHSYKRIVFQGKKINPITKNYPKPTISEGVTPDIRLLWRPFAAFGFAFGVGTIFPIEPENNDQPSFNP